MKHQVQCIVDMRLVKKEKIEGEVHKKKGKKGHVQSNMKEVELDKRHEYLLEIYDGKELIYHAYGFN